MLALSSEERTKLGLAGRQHVLDNYSLVAFADGWDKILTSLHERCGSWDTRGNYCAWEFTEVV